MSSNFITASKLAQFLHERLGKVLIVNVDLFLNYEKSHISHSINFGVPRMLLTKACKKQQKKWGFKLDFLAKGFSGAGRTKWNERLMFEHIVVYNNNDASISIEETPSKILVKMLLKEIEITGGGTNVFHLDSFTDFCRICPEMVQTAHHSMQPMQPMQPMQSTRSRGLWVDVDAEVNPNYPDIQSLQNSLQNSYDEILPGALLGDQSAPRLLLGDQSKIRTIINCAAEVEKPAFLDPKKSYIHLRLHDTSLQQINMDEAAECVRNALKEGGVLIHCHAGVSRSATVLIAYLISEGMTYQDALKFVRSKRPIVEPNFGFTIQLMQHQETIERRERRKKAATMLQAAAQSALERRCIVSQNNDSSKSNRFNPY